MSVVESSPSVQAERATLIEGRVAGAYRTSTDVPPEVRHTTLGDAREIIEELRHSGDLIKQLALRDIRIRYKQAVFGFAWAILIPAAVVLAGTAQLVIQVRLLGWPIRPMIHSAPTIIVLFVVTPISVLVGGLWTDYGTRTTGARQNATF